MENEQIEYVVGELRRGVDRDELANTLRANGYSEEQVNSLLAEGERRRAGTTADAEEEGPDTNSQAAPSAEVSTRTFPSVGTSVRETFSFATRRFDLIGWGVIVPLLGVVPIVAGAALLAGIGTFAGAESGVALLLGGVVLFFAFLFTIAIQFLNNGALTYTALHLEGVRYFDGFGWVWKHFWSFIWVSLLYTLAVMGGFLLLIIPGIIAAVYGSLTLFAYIREDKRGIDAIIRSVELVRGRWWAVFGRYVLVGLIFFIPLMLLNAASEAFFTEADSGGMVLGGLFVAIVQMVLQVVMMLALLRLGAVLYEACSAAPADAETFSPGKVRWTYRILIYLGLLLPVLGILLGVVLTSLESARDRGVDAGNKSALGAIRAEAELYADGHGGSYAGMCEEVVAERPLISFEDTAAVPDCSDSADAYAVEIELTDGSTYCVDSTGVAAERLYSQKSGTACTN